MNRANTSKNKEKKNLEARFRFFSIQDKEKIEKKAREKGLTLSNFIRTLVYEKL